jgi:UrcA family protein
MFTTARIGCVALATIATTAFLNLPAQAEAVDPRVPQVTVSYADLDLKTDAGVQALYRRLKKAALQVCSAYEDYMLKGSRKQRACYDEALAGSVAKVNVDSLSALHKNASDRPRVS